VSQKYPYISTTLITLHLNYLRVLNKPVLNDHRSKKT